MEDVSWSSSPNGIGFTLANSAPLGGAEVRPHWRWGQAAKQPSSGDTMGGWNTWKKHLSDGWFAIGFIMLQDEETHTKKKWMDTSKEFDGEYDLCHSAVFFGRNRYDASLYS